MDTEDVAVVGGCGCYLVYIGLIVAFWALVLAALYKYVFGG